MTEIKLKRGEPVERALRRLKRKLDREGTLKDIRNRPFYEKPSETKRRMEKRALSRTRHQSRANNGIRSRSN
jgi:small subunit ribosomal protein S21